MDVSEVQHANHMPEASPAEDIRLVIWDLDETFWKGTLTEGGIEYIDAHHEIVIELARRGIMSSICSKNDLEPVKQILVEKGLWDYFIFPSINWEPKGQRIAAIVEAVQLRAATILFIDDNALNRNEAVHAVPNLQVADETAIASLLQSPNCKGKNDRELSRLAQYKLLESRKRDQEISGGDNSEFLRNCDIRVYVEYDVAPHIDRAIELINRTNQLNFTKRRLPENLELARQILLAEISQASVQAGLIRVVDRYGDYGFVGFFQTKNGRLQPLPGRAPQTLVDYCFSCRTLGMQVEHWFYDWLRRPELKVQGEVLTDLSENRAIDWIRLSTESESSVANVEQIAAEIRVFGGCEANAVAHYLGAHASKISVIGNFATGSFFVRVNSVASLLSCTGRDGPQFESEMAALGIPADQMPCKFLVGAPDDTMFVFSGGMDANSNHRYKHREFGWEISIEINGRGYLNFINSPREEIDTIIQAMPNDVEKARFISVLEHVRNNYEVVVHDDSYIKSQMLELFDVIPARSKLVIILDAECVRLHDGTIKDAPWVTNYNRMIKSILSFGSNVFLVSFGDFIQNENEIHVGGNHYDRMVYARLSRAICEAVLRRSVVGALKVEASSSVSETIKKIMSSENPTDRLRHEIACAVRDQQNDFATKLFESASVSLMIKDFWVFYEAARAYHMLGKSDLCFITSLMALQYRFKNSRHSYLPFLYAFNYLSLRSPTDQAIDLFLEQVSECPEIPVAEPWKIREICSPEKSQAILDRLVGVAATNSENPIVHSAVEAEIHNAPNFLAYGGELPPSLVDLRGISARPEISVFELKTCRVFISDGLIVTLNGRDEFHPSATTAPYPRATYKAFLEKQEGVSIVQVENAILIADKFPSPNICHFLFDHLTRLYLYERCGIEWRGATIIGPELSLPYQREVVEKLGISNYIGIGGNKVLNVENLFVSSNCVSLMHPAHCGAAWALDFLWSRLGRGESGSRRIYISRSDASGRRIVNETELTAFLSKLGFERVVLSGLSFEEQKKIFCESNVVIGVHGAGLANAVFAPPGTVVIEIFHPLYATPGYAAIAEASAWKYVAIIGKDGHSVDPEFNDPKVGTHGSKHMARDILLSVDLVRMALAENGIEAP